MHKLGPLILSNGYRDFVYDIAFENKIIEVNGDFWHANPSKYKADDVLQRGTYKTLAANKWKRDAYKAKVANDRGYEVMIVWESDFYADQDSTIERCIAWLKT